MLPTKTPELGSVSSSATSVPNTTSPPARSTLKSPLGLGHAFGTGLWMALTHASEKSNGAANADGCQRSTPGASESASAPAT